MTAQERRALRNKQEVGNRVVDDAEKLSAVHEAQRSESKKRGWLPVDTVAVVLGVPSFLYYLLEALAGYGSALHLVDVVDAGLVAAIGTGVLVGLIYLVAWPIRWGWRKARR